VEAQYGRYVGGKYQWIIMDPCIAPTGTLAHDWEKLD